MSTIINKFKNHYITIECGNDKISGEWTTMHIDLFSSKIIKIAKSKNKKSAWPKKNDQSCIEAISSLNALTINAIGCNNNLCRKEKDNCPFDNESITDDNKNVRCSVKAEAETGKWEITPKKVKVGNNERDIYAFCLEMSISQGQKKNCCNAGSDGTTSYGDPVAK